MFVHTCSLSNLAARGLDITVGAVTLSFGLRGYQLSVACGPHSENHVMPLKSNERHPIALPHGHVYFLQKTNSKKITVLVDVPREVNVTVHKR